MKLIFLSVMIFAGLVSNAQLAPPVVNINNNLRPLVISGMRQDNFINVVKSELSFSIFETFSHNQINSHSSHLDVNFSSDGKFTLNLPVYGDIKFLKIAYKFDNMYNSFFRGTNIYRIPNSDSLQCKLFPDSIWFSGKWADEMNIQTRLFKLSDSYNSTSTASGRDRYTEQKAIREKVFQQQIELLKASKDKLRPEIYKYLYYQCLGIKEQRLLGAVLGESMLALPLVQRKAGIEFYSTHLKKNVEALDQDLHICFYYMDYLYKKEKMEYYLSRSEDLTKMDLDVTEFVKSIVAKYQGKIRDKLILTAYTDLTRSLTAGQKRTNILSYINQATEIVEYAPYKTILIELKEGLTAGQPAYPFSLPDSSGKIAKMTDFIGKTVILDFWFTGCIPCRALSKKMQPVIERFKRADVVFLSINTDTDKNMWRKSLRGGEYTHEEYINLYTDGKGAKHAIINHYNIVGFPTLIVVDKLGNIVTTTPPNPRVDDGKGLIKVIENSLTK